jgi:hypothetical protein
MTAQGMLVSPAVAQPAPPVPPPGYLAQPLPPGVPIPAPYPGWSPAGYAGILSPGSDRSTDWVLWVRIAIAVPSLLGAALLMLVGLLVRQITLPASAGTVPQTVDLGPAIVVAVVAILAVTALIVWLAKFAVVRAILLLLVAVGVVSVLAQMGTAVSADRIAFLIDLGWDIVYGALLILSLVSPRPQPL